MADIELRLGVDVLVIQGAMGTMLAAQGFGPAQETCYPFLNLTEPETVEELHRRYLDAGADCAVTNTFLATSSRLAAFGLEGCTDQVNVEGVRIARGLGFQHVLASVGPCGVEVEPGSGVAALHAEEVADAACAPADGRAPSYLAAVEQYAEQVAALASAGPDAILLETFTQVDDALAAIEASRRVCGLPVLACMALAAGPDLAERAAAAARLLAEAAAAAVGCNCMAVEDTVVVVNAMRAACDLPLIARPNAGTPRELPDGTLRWPFGPDDFAAAAPRLLKAGATLVGSCCGSNPACTGALFASIGGIQL